MRTLAEQHLYGGNLKEATTLITKGRNLAGDWLKTKEEISQRIKQEKLIGTGEPGAGRRAWPTWKTTLAGSFASPAVTKSDRDRWAQRALDPGVANRTTEHWTRAAQAKPAAAENNRAKIKRGRQERLPEPTNPGQLGAGEERKNTDLGDALARSRKISKLRRRKSGGWEMRPCAQTMTSAQASRSSRKTSRKRSVNTSLRTLLRSG
jgi:hypothetical protein